MNGFAHESLHPGLSILVKLTQAFLSQRYTFFFFLLFIHISRFSPQKGQNNLLSHCQWIKMLIPPNPDYHWDAKGVHHSISLSRTPQRTVPPTTTGWLTIPVCPELRRILGHETFSFKTWKVPGTWNEQVTLHTRDSCAASQDFYENRTCSTAEFCYSWLAQGWTPGPRMANHLVRRDGLSQSHFFFGEFILGTRKEFISEQWEIGLRFIS